ncbi:MAG: S8 family serine peptidase, partial [archaeon]|nr:S8 family serine peptidase [archaeon]
MKLKYTKSNLRRINIFILISIILIFPMVISSNLSLYDSNIEDITKITNEEIILNNENLSTQTNYLVNRTQMNYVWNTLNFTGDSNASVAILSTGIDENQIKFGFDSYEDKNFTKKIVYWNDSTSIDSSTPIDPNGLGTFLSAVAFGRNNSDAELILDEQNRISTTLGGYYEHSDIMRGELKPGIYNISLGSFLINEENVNITINGTFTEIGATSEIQNANLSIYKNNSLVCRTNTISSTNYEIENYNITDNTGCYDVIFQYYHGLPDPDIACFSINTILNFSYNQCITNVANLSGVAPDTKIYSMRVLNESGEGYVNDLISALNWIISDHSDYNVVAATISLGTYDWTGTTLELLNNTIDDLIDEGIMVIIAAGDSGLNNDALNTLAQNQKALVVGAVNEYDQITYYSSMGKTIDGVTTKPDILAPGGSLLTGYQGIISADSNDNDGQGYYVDQASNDTTIMAGTSISATIVSAAYNLLVEAIGGYNIWENIMNEDMALLLKSYLLMTATETNINREDNPNTTYDESSISPVVNRGEKDIHEGFGVLNIEAALEAINRTMYVGNPESENIVSSNVNSSGRHVFARHISLEGNATYFFNLTFPSSAGTDLDLYLYYNETDTIGEPIILESSTTAGVSNESFYLGMLNETQNYFIVVKAVNGGDVEFLLDIEKQDNIWRPTLTDANIVSADGATSFNDTLQIFDFSINYTDKDNLAPLDIYLNISGLENNISLTKSNQDNNYTNGCFYTGSHRFYEAGTYL